MASADAKFVRAVANHIILPPDLPGAVDKNLAEINRDLLKRTQDACAELKAVLKGAYRQELSLLESSLDYCFYIHTSIYVDSSQLHRAFGRLQKGEILIVHISEQNAGLLIRHGTGTLEGHVVFEAFEVSALSATVLDCHNALQWTFPTSAAAIPATVFKDEAFQQHLAEFLQQGSRENIKRFGAVTHKAKSFAHEPRDTADPALITALLISLLEGIGRLVQVTPITKRVKDEVRWKDSLIPWRRSPFWLLLRLGLLRHLTESTNPAVANVLYKALLALLQARLLHEMVGSQSPELCHLLLKKLCRRIAKMEKDREMTTTSDNDIQAVHNLVLDNIRPLLFRATRNAQEQLQNAWDSYKSRIQRRIAPLQTRFARPEHCTLGLKSSSAYLSSMRQHPLLKKTTTTIYVMPQAMSQLIEKHFELSQTEEEALARDRTAAIDTKELVECVLQLAEKIESYLSRVGGRFYQVGTVERSRMILAAMWLWISMDRLICLIVPTFTRYEPVFSPTLMDCLLLASHHDLCRLHEAQSYLASRHANATSSISSRTIFNVPVPGCFGHRYFENLSIDSEHHVLRDEIQKDEEDRKRHKATEWGEKDAEHQRILKELVGMTCQFTLTGDLLIPEHNEHKCPKCSLTKKADRIRIERIESALPTGLAEMSTVLLELCCPRVLAVYRDATWAIAANLGLPVVEPTTKEPLTMVKDYYTGLSDWRARHPTKSAITLASRTKSFLQTHFRFAHFPVSLEKVCVNNGLRFEYYDIQRKLWPSEYLTHITFSHHCWIPILRATPFAQVEFPMTAQPERGNASSTARTAEYLLSDADITSNEILASLPRCPQVLGLPEIAAFQGLLAKSHRFWPCLLVELGSSNLNFSSEAVMILLQSLIHRTGRPLQDGSHSSNAALHDVFFCRSLLNQVERRLTGISSNWRECYLAETVLSLILKVVILGPHEVRGSALQLLEDIRRVTLSWIKTIREELWKTVSHNAAASLAHCILWAALLCRRTFTIYSTPGLEQPGDFSDATSYANTQRTQNAMPSSALVVFLEASISLQENLPQDMSKVSLTLRTALSRDLHSVSRLQSCLQTSLGKDARTLVTAAVNSKALSAAALSHRPTSFAVQQRVDGPWMQIVLSDRTDFQAVTIDFHLVAGTLLLDGRPVEREPPAQVRDAESTKRLFPNYRLITYPSTLPGMTYKAVLDPEGQEVHFGFRQNNLIVRIWSKQLGLWEYIPAGIFGGDNAFDLPASLVDGCVHWLNLMTNVIEIRKIFKPWRSAPANWNIDLNTRMANRRRSLLLDPGSNLFHHFASIFQGFEDRRHVTVYQPEGFPLAVELRRYDLSFLASRTGYLECRQLRATFDADQDAGTWYGLSSKLVLRDNCNPSERSVLVPLGLLSIHRRGMHVNVNLQRGSRDVGRFVLDEVLGRVTCAPEPRLMYTKALLHATTSFCLPDPLTGRVGADEACHILEAGACQPYTPLTDINRFILSNIANLSPNRQYYPEDLRVMETVTWDAKLTPSIQDDRYWSLVNTIMRKHECLAPFELKEEASGRTDASSTLPENPTSRDTNENLTKRGQIRRRNYQQPRLSASIFSVTDDGEDAIYHSRGYQDSQQSQEYVFEVARLIHNWPEILPSTTLLHLMMQKWPHITGYGDGTVVYDKIRLTDHLDIDVASSWGPLVNLCRLLHRSTKFRLLFLLGTFAFNDEVDVRALHTLIAFAIFPELKTVDLPSWPSYTQYRPGFIPKADYLKKLLVSSCIKPFQSTTSVATTQRERRATEAA